jgi:hypothetical protein
MKLQMCGCINFTPTKLDSKDQEQKENGRKEKKKCLDGSSVTCNCKNINHRK